MGADTGQVKNKNSTFELGFHLIAFVMVRIKKKISCDNCCFVNTIKIIQILN